MKSKNPFIIGVLLLLTTGCSECSRSGRNAELARAQREQKSISNPSSSETAPVPMTTAQGQTVILMSEQNGVYYVPVTMNGLTLDFIFDTGASNILISYVEFMTLVRQGKVSENDLMGSVQFRDASGNINEAQLFMIRELKLGNRILYDVEAMISESLDAPLLLGQSALARFGNVEIDYQNSRIIIK